MPTYEYTCKQCGEHLEVVQSFKDDPLSECHNCGGELRKVFGSVGIVFKGSGFYKTDNRSGSSRKPDKVESGTKSTESKPERAAKSEAPAKSDSSKPDSSSSNSSTPAAAAS